MNSGADVVINTPTNAQDGQGDEGRGVMPGWKCSTAAT
jgi:hypothetical protein